MNEQYQKVAYIGLRNKIRVSFSLPPKILFIFNIAI